MEPVSHSIVGMVFECESLGEVVEFDCVVKQSQTPLKF